jgi:hypothetical protein
VDGGGLQMAKLGEELLNIAVGDAEVQVGDNQLGGAAGGDDAAATSCNKGSIMVPILP